MGKSKCNEEQILRKKVTTLEEQVKSLKRDLDQARKRIGRLRKQSQRAGKVEADLREVLENEDIPQVEEPVVKSIQNNLRCRVQECKSEDTKIVVAGVRTIVVCSTCGARYTIKTKEPTDENLYDEKRKRAG